MQGHETTDWQFTRSDLGRTPSVSSGWTVEREELDRAKACGLIHSASRKLKLPQITTASACVFLHRFFMRHSLKEYHHYNIAATCLFFACKSEETLRKLDDFIPIIVHYASKGMRTAPPGTLEFDKWRAVILRTEISLLQALCFDTVIEHPHVALAGIAEELQLGKRASQMAWGFVGDCMRLPVCLVFDPKTIACACVSLAGKVAGADERCLADDVWLDRVGASRSEVAEVVQWVLEFYAREAQSRLAGANAEHALEVSPTPASSPGSTTSPMN